jgi:hypothetical protein
VDPVGLHPPLSEFKKKKQGREKRGIEEGKIHEDRTSKNEMWGGGENRDEGRRGGM